MQGAEASIPCSWVLIFSPGWREAQSRLTSSPRMLSHMKQLASVGIEPQPLDYESNTLPTEPHETLCLYIVEDMAQDTTTQIKGSWMFLNNTHQYPNKKKHFGHSFAFDAVAHWIDLPDDVRSAPNLACFRKNIKSYLFDKAFPP